jgi:hypothetical protein
MDVPNNLCSKLHVPPVRRSLPASHLFSLGLFFLHFFAFDLPSANFSPLPSLRCVSPPSLSLFSPLLLSDSFSLRLQGSIRSFVSASSLSVSSVLPFCFPYLE